MGPDQATLDALRSAGVSQQELDAQRFAYMSLGQSPRTPRPDLHRGSSSLSNNNNTNNNNNNTTNELLDKENNVVVEILTDEEYTALEKWWPRVHSSFCLRFSVDVGDGSIEWSTPPCRDCDASGKSNEILPQLQKLVKKQQQPSSSSSSGTSTPGSHHKKKRHYYYHSNNNNNNNNNNSNNNNGKRRTSNASQ
uniref:Uncharacterized protein n=1 Tax=Cyclophora tenuis TaxID=216820 RepID=A0A7S1D1E5_CYCTE|mmetsp:Transcript_18474/g.31560  ORF Transcript_18474/g.31560 Transcript_18474/m.31560 type:complete len:194 (+) Transcript_18474:134-715(+)